MSEWTPAIEPPPYDYLDPNWRKEDRIHNWRNYISRELMVMWDTFTPEQKAVIARNADEQASREDWE